MRRTSIAAEAATAASMGSCALWTKTAEVWRAVTSLTMAMAHRPTTIMSSIRRQHLGAFCLARTSRMISIMAAATIGRREPPTMLRMESRITTSTSIAATRRGRHQCRRLCRHLRQQRSHRRNPLCIPRSAQRRSLVLFPRHCQRRGQRSTRHSIRVPNRPLHQPLARPQGQRLHTV
jgi:hypothetical protein